MHTLFTIIRKELKSYLDHPVGYVFIIIFIVLNNFFFFKSALISNLSTIRPLFDLLPWILLFLIPAVTMRLAAEERKTGTWELLLTQPVKDYMYILGKWLASTIFVSLNILLTLLIPITLTLVGTFDWGAVTAQYIGAILLTASLSTLGLFASQLTKNQIIAFLIALVLSFFFIIAGADIVTLALPKTLRNIFLNLSLLSHYNNLTRGVIDIRDLIYAFSFIGSFLALTFWKLRQTRVNTKTMEWKKLQSGIAGLVIIAILINLFGSYIRGRIDFTEGNIYTLSPASKEIVANLDDLIHIKAYISDELPPEIAATTRDIKDLLADLNTHSKGKIIVHYINPTASLEAEEAARLAGIPPIQFNVMRQNEFQVKQGYIGLSIEYIDQKETIPYIDDTSGLEYAILSRVKKLTDDSQKQIAFLTGHGEKGITSEYAALADELEKQYKVTEINLDEEESAIDENIQTIIVAGPKEEIPQKTLTDLETFVSNGGSLFLLLDAVDINPQFLSATPNKFNGSALANKFGITLNSDLVFDLRSNESVTFGGGAINYILPYPFWLRTLPNHEHQLSRELESIVVPWGSSITLQDEETTELLTTSEFAYTQKGTFNIDPKQQLQVSQNDVSTLTLAAAKQIGDTGRIVVVGDSDFISAQFIQNSPNNLSFALNTIDWLAQDESLISIRSKNRIPAPLVFETNSQKNAIKYINLFGLPILVLIAGALRLFLRRKKIKQMVF